MVAFAFEIFDNVSSIYNNTQNPEGLRISGFFSVAGAIFILTVNSYLEAYNPVSLTFPIERAVFLKENGSNMYGIIPYFLSRNLV